MEKKERILVPLDGSDCAENIIPKVEELAERNEEGICLLRVAMAHTFPGVDQTEAQVEVVREAEEYLHDMEGRLKAKGFDVDAHVRYGNEVEEILEHAAQKEIGLIAMSTRRHSGIRHLFRGCVAEKVLRRTPKPVFLAQCDG
ncbi:MAG: universal stress protein [Thermodesulfobacteriota bacterium]|jgi:nucleotide-binding universal stress UspA family protein